MDFAANVAHHRFEISTLSPDTFEVLSYRGTEAISQPFRYEIALSSVDPEVLFDAVMNQPAVLTTRRGGEQAPVHGIVVDFREEGPSAARDRYRYRAVLAPRLWLLSLHYQSRIFQEQTVEEILTEVFDAAGLPRTGVRVELSESYAPREYCVQYQETDLAFVQRLLEYEGIRFFFEHDGQEEVLVLTDAPDAGPSIPGPATIGFSSDQGLVPDDESIYRFAGRERVVTGSVVLKDYNYRTPETELEVESQLNDSMPGLRYEYGSHFADANTGQRLARVRNEEIECQRRVLQGESDCAGLRPGYVFTLTGHYRGDADGDYLVTHVEHHGTHAGSEFEFAGNGRRGRSDGGGGAGMEPRRGGEGSGGEAGSGSDAGAGGAASDVIYRNAFTCIPAGVPYRPPRTTPVPQVPGLMTARTESGGGDYAYVDEEGRYRLRMDFDRRSATGQGEATLPIRKGQIHTGPNHGVHFGEHADTEMVWACLNGDPDRPIALSSVSNPSQKSPVVSGNKAENVIRTRSGNQIVLDDTIDKAKIRLETPDAHRMEFDDDTNRIHLESTDEHSITLDDEKKRLHVKTKKGRIVTLDDDKEAITIQSENEHFIRINDKNDVITLSDNKKENRFIIDIKNEKIVIETKQGSIDLHAPKGKIDIQAKELNVETSGDTTMKAANLTTEATADHSMKAANISTRAKMDLKQEGTNVTSKAAMEHKTSGMNIKSQASLQNDVAAAMLNLKASGINTIQGSLVKIN